MRRRAFVPAAALAALILAVVAVFAATQYAGSQADPYAVRVNGKEYTQEDIESGKRITELLFKLTSKLGVDYQTTPQDAATERNAAVERIIESELFDQEAKRRKISCSDAEVQKAQRENFIAGGEVALAYAVAAGFAPPEYFDVPAAKRTPDANSLIDAYLSDGRVLVGLHRICRLTKLFEQLTLALDKPNDNNARNKAIFALRDSLRGSAVIDIASAPEAGEPYTILVDAIADGAVGAVQTSASVPNGGTRKIEVEVLGVPSGLGGYSVVFGWDPAKLSVTAANIIDKTGFTQVAKSVNAAAGTLTVGYYNGADITCTNPAAGGAAEGASSAVLFEVTFTGIAAGLSTLTFNPVLTEIGLCDGAGGVSAPTVLQSAELTVSP